MPCELIRNRITPESCPEFRITKLINRLRSFAERHTELSIYLAMFAGLLLVVPIALSA